MLHLSNYTTEHVSNSLIYLCYYSTTSYVFKNHDFDICFDIYGMCIITSFLLLLMPRVVSVVINYNQVIISVLQ